MPVHDDLGTRMKEFYEGVPKTRLVRRMPVAIRIDGKAFHTFTRGFMKPFDKILMQSMQETAKYLCENIQGCVFGYTQSDEITLILVDYQKLNSSAWFDYEVQKLCSISASMATVAFNKIFVSKATEFIQNCAYMNYSDGIYGPGTPEYEACEAYDKAIQKGAMFDARCFNIPKEEVCNLIYWRQLDAMRNSVQMVGQANFSHKELQNKSCNMIKEMLLDQKDIDWDDYPVVCQRGAAIVKSKVALIPAHCETAWIIDTNMPILKGEDRRYIDDLIYVGEE